jgi:ATP-dependent protease ClpP protease subunit
MIAGADGSQSQRTGPVTSLQSVITQLSRQEGFTSVKVVIRSEGGWVTEGFAIADYLRSLSVPITTQAFGNCDSIATVVFLAGSSRQISPNATMLVHLPSGGIQGNADEIEDYNRSMQAARQQMVDYYVSRTGMFASQALEMMRRSTNLSASLALQTGFATSVLPLFDAVRAEANIRFEEAIAAVNTSQDKMNTLEILNAAKDKVLALFSTPTVAGNPIKALALSLNDGTAIEVHTAEALPAVGDQVSVEGQAAPDGAHVLADGTTVTTQGGVIANIEIPPSPEEMEKIEKLEQDNARLQEELEALKAAQAQMVAEQSKEVTALKEAQAIEAKRQEERFTAVQTMLKNITSQSAPAVSEQLEEKQPETKVNPLAAAIAAMKPAK